MKQKTIIIILSVALLLSIGGGVAVYAASNLGTKDDPLVTKSYLTDKLTPELMAELQGEMDAKIAALEGRINKAIADGGATADSYVFVTLAAGQKLSGTQGTEMLLRTGAGACVSTDGILDMSSGETLTGGAALAANHLYLIYASGDGFSASAASTLLVRGTYSVN